jgi:phosphonoacetate hydrolase
MKPAAAPSKQNVTSLSRRGFLMAAGAATTALITGRTARGEAKPTKAPQRVCVVFLDGFGTDYYERSHLPTLRQWARDGFFKRVRGVMPSVTNVNLAGVCCGVHADKHGITANSYWDAEAGRERFMSDGNLLTATTLFQRAARFGVQSVLVSAKQKTIPLIGHGAAWAVGSQQPPPEAIRRYGAPPDIYSVEVNYWVWKVALDVIEHRPRVGLIFVHTTDYPMHRYAPDASESQAHLRTIDTFLKAAAEADPGLAFFVVADHGLNAKATVLNLDKALAARGVGVEVVLSAERDQYPRHHSGYGGTAFVYLKDPGTADKAAEALRGIEGVEEVLTREEAARRYRLNPHRIGDLWVTATKAVVFGPAAQEREILPKGYRSHGSAHELDIPCIIYRYAGQLPNPAEVRTNVDVYKFLYRG